MGKSLADIRQEAFDKHLAEVKAFEVPVGKPRSSSDIRVAPATVHFALDPGKCDPSFKRECDVNHLMKDYEKDGVSITDMAEVYYSRKGIVANKGQFVDASEAVMFTEALKIVADGESMFMQLDARVRQRFNHSPAEFLKFMEDPRNLQEMVDLGLATQVEVDDVLSRKNDSRLFGDDSRRSSDSVVSGKKQRGSKNADGGGNSPGAGEAGGSTSSST